jgi:FkbM family methyltransferase
LKQVCGVWLPDEEEEIAKFLRAEQVDGVGVYQYTKLKAALEHVKQWRNAIDVGAHVGCWSMQMAKKFKKVYAFEPVERHRECFVLNAPNVELYPYALGEKPGMVRLTKGIKSTGDTHISPKGEYEAELRTLDSFGFKEVDFLKMDCEGYELFVLRGGERLIQECKPAIVVEQKPNKGSQYGLHDTAAVRWLVERGYKLRGEIYQDFFLSVP